MNEPRRLNQSGGVSQRLLDSASIDKPSVAARRRAQLLAATANSFATTRPGASGTPAAASRASTGKTLATWIVVGAAASVSVAFLGSQLLDSNAGRSAASLGPPAMSVLGEPATPPPVAPAQSPEIASEPPSPQRALSPSAAVKPTPSTSVVEPWIPSPVAIPSGTVARGATAPRSRAFFDEVEDIEAARSAIARGDDNAALAKLNDYDHAHPNGTLKPESTVLRIQALSNSGNTAEARTLSNEFQSKYPQHPLVQRVRRELLK